MIRLRVRVGVRVRPLIRFRVRVGVRVSLGGSRRQRLAWL